MNDRIWRREAKAASKIHESSLSSSSVLIVSAGSDSDDDSFTVDANVLHSPKASCSLYWQFSNRPPIVQSWHNPWVSKSDY